MPTISPLRMRHGALLLLCTALAQPALSVARDWQYLPDASRTTAAPIHVSLVLAQDTLIGGDDPSPAAPATFMVTGVLDRMIVDSVYNAIRSAKNRKARDVVEPLIPALAGFDANAILIKSLDQNLTHLGWAKLGDVSVITSPSQAAAAPKPAPSSPATSGALSCAYMLSGELDALYATCEIMTHDGAGALLSYRRSEVQVGLKPFAADRDARKAQWLANDAALLKRGLTVALTQLGHLSVDALAQNAASHEAYEKARKANLGRYLDYRGGVMIAGIENTFNGSESCFNRRNKAGIKPDTDGLVIQEENGSVFQCVGISVP